MRLPLSQPRSVRDTRGSRGQRSDITDTALPSTRSMFDVSWLRIAIFLFVFWATLPKGSQKHSPKYRRQALTPISTLKPAPFREQQCFDLNDNKFQPGCLIPSGQSLYSLIPPAIHLSDIVRTGTPIGYRRYSMWAGPLSVIVSWGSHWSPRSSRLGQGLIPEVSQGSLPNHCACRRLRLYFDPSVVKITAINLLNVYRRLCVL